MPSVQLSAQAHLFRKRDLECTPTALEKARRWLWNQMRIWKSCEMLCKLGAHTTTRPIEHPLMGKLLSKPNRSLQLQAWQLENAASQNTRSVALLAVESKEPSIEMSLLAGGNSKKATPVSIVAALQGKQQSSLCHSAANQQ